MECWKVQVGELFLVINVKADWWPGQIWWATTPLFISRPAILGESGLLAQKVMWNFVLFFLFEYYCDNCKISLKNKNNLDSHQSSSHAAMNYSFVSMDENPTFRLWIWFSNFSSQLPDSQLWQINSRSTVWPTNTLILLLLSYKSLSL